jgi:hypothetical protein
MNRQKKYVAIAASMGNIMEKPLGKVRIRTYVYESRKTSRANDDPALCLQSSFLFLCLSFLLDSFPPATDGFTM